MNNVIDMPDTRHKWLTTTWLPLDEADASEAVRTGKLELGTAINAQPGVKIDAVDVFCGQCRLPYDRVHEQPCAEAP